MNIVLVTLYSWMNKEFVFVFVSFRLMDHTTHFDHLSSGGNYFDGKHIVISKSHCASFK